jgi:hypothetical protein
MQKIFILTVSVIFEFVGSECFEKYSTLWMATNPSAMASRRITRSDPVAGAIDIGEAPSRRNGVRP